MATTTPNYGWDVPTSSDYVKLGAVAIETLGDDIDASLFSITGGKNVGYVPLSTNTFTSSTSVIVSNVFSSAYANYAIVVDYIAAANASGQIYLRDGGGDIAGANYQVQRLDIASTSVSAFRLANQTVGQFPDYGATRSCIQAIIYAPNLAQVTQWQATGNYNPATTQIGINWSSGSYTANTVATGFRLASTGALTGTLTVYGLRSA